MMRLLPLLVAAPLASSFTPCSPISPTLRNTQELRAAPNADDILKDAGKAAGSALLGLTLAFTAINAPAVPVANAATFFESSSVTLSRSAPKKEVAEDEVVIQQLEKETRAIEKEAKIDAKKARIEKSREAYYAYDAKMAQQTEDRIEAEEKRAEAEYEKDKEEAAELMALEKKAERDVELAGSKQEKAAKLKEAKALLAKEKEIERKERKAEKLEKIFRAEEVQEKKILAQKVAAERAEEAKFEKVEKEYESVAELAKEDEVELSLLKDLSQKKK